jgi:hypothetical protein
VLDGLSLVILGLAFIGMSIYSANLRVRLENAERWVDEIIEELEKES